MRTIVSTGRCATYDSAALGECLTEVLAPLGGMGHFVAPGQQVALKPNLLAPSKAQEAVVTHPQFVGAVALAVREAGGEPFVTDSPAFGTLHQVAEHCGLDQVCNVLGVPLVPLRRSIARTVETARGARRVRVGRAIAEADVVLNLPKLKAHRQLGLSAGIKNLYGCVPGKRKIVGHFRGGPVDLHFARMIVEHHLAAAPALALVDGIVAMQGIGPRKGDPRTLGLVLAGTDAVALDALLCEVLQAPTDHRMLLVAARELGVGETDLARVEIHGPSLDELRVTDFPWPPLIGTQFGLPRVVKSWVRNLWVSRLGLAGARQGPGAAP